MAAVLLYRRECEDARARNLTDHRALAWNRPGGIRGAEIIGERWHSTGSPWVMKMQHDILTLVNHAVSDDMF